MAIAGLLDAAEWNRVVGPTIGVHMDHPGADAPHHAVRAGQVAGPDRRSEAIIAVIGDFQRIFFIVEGNDRKDGAENLLAGERHAGFDIEDGRLHVETAGFFEDALAAGAQPCAFRKRLLRL